MKNLFSIFVLASIFMFTCKNEAKLVSPSGYEYVFHKKGDGTKADTGLYAYFLFDIKADDDTTQLMPPRDLSQIERALITPPQNNGQQENAIIEGLRLMHIGDSISIFMKTDSIVHLLPPDLQHVKTIEHVISLKDLKTKEEFDADIAKITAELEEKASVVKERRPAVEELVRQTLSDYKKGKLNDELLTLETGEKILIHEKGTGAQVENNENVSAQYYGVLEADGTRFDDSFGRGQPFTFTVGIGQVIPGWDNAFAQLTKGSKATIFIPSQNGYGEAGSPPIIPENSNLVFYVEVE